MSKNVRRWERPVASIAELIEAVQRESAAALSTADAFFRDAPRTERLDLPHRFPAPGRHPDEPDARPRDATG